MAVPNSSPPRGRLVRVWRTRRLTSSAAKHNLRRGIQGGARQRDHHHSDCRREKKRMGWRDGGDGNRRWVTRAGEGGGFGKVFRLNLEANSTIQIAREGRGSEKKAREAELELETSPTRNAQFELNSGGGEFLRCNSSDNSLPKTHAKLNSQQFHRQGIQGGARQRDHHHSDRRREKKRMGWRDGDDGDRRWVTRAGEGGGSGEVFRLNPEANSTIQIAREGRGSEKKAREAELELETSPIKMPNSS